MHTCFFIVAYPIPSSSYLQSHHHRDHHSLSLSVYTIQHNFLLIFLFSYFLPKRTIIYPLMMDLFNLNQNCLHFENINQVCSSSSDVEISSHFICLSQFCFRKTHFTRLPTQSWPFSSLFLHSSSSSSYFSLLA